jgi:hypothetical protein
MLEIHLAGKTTEKRQNFDPLHTSSPRRASPLHVKWRNQEAPGAPVTRAQTAWEDADQVSFAVRGTSTDNPGPDQHSPLDKPTSTWGKKRNWIISNKNNKDTLQRGWGALSSEERGKGTLPGTVNKQAGLTREALLEVGVCTQQPGAGKLVRVAEGGKLHRRGGKTHLPHEL